MRKYLWAYLNSPIHLWTNLSIYWWFTNFTSSHSHSAAQNKFQLITTHHNSLQLTQNPHNAIRASITLLLENNLNLRNSLLKAFAKFIRKISKKFRIKLQITSQGLKSNHSNAAIESTTLDPTQINSLRTLPSEIRQQIFRYDIKWRGNTLALIKVP